MVALGRVPGWEIYRKFGANPDIDAGTEDCWSAGGVRTWPSSAGVVTVVSSLAADASGGTGARTLTLYGLDANYDRITETITLNGVTPVVTSASFLRFSRAIVATAGTGETNAGVITFTVGGNLQGTIQAGNGQTEICMDTVPNGYNLIVTAVLMTTGRSKLATNDLRVEGQVKTFGGAWRSILINELYQTDVKADLKPVVLPAKTDFRIRGISTGADATLAATVAGYLVREGY